MGTEKKIFEKMVSAYKEGDTEVITNKFIQGIPEHAQHILPNASLYAKNIFAIFRSADKKGIKTILINGIEETGLGNAVMNRIKKAASVIFV
jgi:hypothetical protein